MIPSTLENRKKRIVIKDIDGIKGQQNPGDTCKIRSKG